MHCVHEKKRKLMDAKCDSKVNQLVSIHSPLGHYLEHLAIKVTVN
jgi:hypothetical protein